MTAGTDVVAVHLGHHDPPAAELSAVPAGQGARLAADGDRLTVRCAAVAPGA